MYWWEINNAVGGLVYLRNKGPGQNVIEEIMLSYSRNVERIIVTIKGYSYSSEELKTKFNDINSQLKEDKIGIKFSHELFGRVPVYDAYPLVVPENTALNNQQLSVLLYQLHTIQPFDGRVQTYINEELLFKSNHINFQPLAKKTNWYQLGIENRDQGNMEKAIENFAKVEADDINYVMANYLASFCSEIYQPDNLAEHFKYLSRANINGDYFEESIKLFDKICNTPGQLQKLDAKEIEPRILLQIAHIRSRENRRLEDKLINLNNFPKQKEEQLSLIGKIDDLENKLRLKDKKIKELEEQLKNFKEQYTQKTEKDGQIIDEQTKQIEELEQQLKSLSLGKQEDRGVGNNPLTLFNNSSKGLDGLHNQQREKNSSLQLG